MINFAGYLERWNSFWHGDQTSRAGLDFFRFFFYASIGLIFCTDYYGQFFINLSYADPALIQPTVFSPLFSFVSTSTENLSLLRAMFVASCALAALGIVSRLTKLTSAVIGLYVLNLLSSFGNWNHTVGPVAITLIFLCLVPCSYRFSIDHLWGWDSKEAPQAWLFKLIQVMVLWSYFSSGLYKLFYSGFDWVTANSLRNYLIFANYLEKHTTHEWLAHVAIQWPMVCWFAGLLALLIELTCPLALLNQRLRSGYFTLLVLFQVMIYLALKENFVMMLPLLPALFLGRRDPARSTSLPS